MIGLALRTFGQRWQLFVGAILAVAFGVALVHSGLAVIAAAARAVPPPELDRAGRIEFADALESGTTLAGMAMVLATFLTIFVVGSTFGFTVAERRRELALLRLVGLKRRQLMATLLGEGALIGLAGGALGVVFGAGATAVQTTILTRMGALPTSVEVAVPGWLPAVDLALAVGVSLVGVHGPARSAARVRPLEAVQATPAATRVMTAWRWLVGAAALAATTAAAWSARSSDMVIAILLGLLIVVTGSVALSRLSPLLVPQVSRALRALVGRSVIGGLAEAHLRDGVRRSASVAAPLIVLVGLVVGLQGILDTQVAAGARERIAFTQGDLVVSGTGEDVDVVRQTSGVALASPRSQVPVPITLDRANRSFSTAEQTVAVDPADYWLTSSQPATSGDPSAMGGDTVIFGGGLIAEDVGGTWSSITAEIAGAQVPLRMIARMPETISPGDGFVISSDLVPGDVLSAAPTTIIVQLAPGADANQVKRDLAASGVGAVQTITEWADAEAVATSDDNRSVMAVLVGLGGLYALISVLSTVTIGSSGRKAEFATLRLTGLSRRQVVGMAVLESWGATFIGWLLGAVVAAACLMGLARATAATLGEPVVAVPWGLAAAMAGVTVVGVTIAAAASTHLATSTAPVRLAAARE